MKRPAIVISAFKWERSVRVFHELGVGNIAFSTYRVNTNLNMSLSQWVPPVDLGIIL